MRFSSSTLPCEGGPLERGYDANAERSVARIRAAIDAPILIADVAGRSKDIRGGQSRIETIVAGDREQILRLHVNSRRGRPAREPLRNVVADLQVAQPRVGSVL